MIYLGQEVEVSKVAGRFVRAWIPGTFMFVQTEALRKFLVAQGQYSFMPKIQLVTAMLHPLWLYINVYCLNLSIEGVAFSTVITHSLNFLISYVWITLDQSIVKEGCWHFINKDSFTGYFEFLRFAIPSFLNLGLEVWSFQFIHFRAGFLGTTQLGASVILMNLQTFLFMAPFGTSLVASSIIGNSLGASKPRTANMYIKAIITTVSFITLAFTFCLMVFRHQIAAIFTTDEGIRQEMVSGIFVTSLITFPDGLHTALFGIMKAMGYQHYGTPISFV